MSEKRTLPEDFDPWLASDAMKGLSEAIYWFVTEGPAADEPLSRDAHSSLIGLTWTMRNLAHELHAYMARLSAAGIELPTREKSSGGQVNETPGDYVLN